MKPVDFVNVEMTARQPLNRRVKAQVSWGRKSINIICLCVIQSISILLLIWFIVYEIIRKKFDIIWIGCRKENGFFDHFSVYQYINFFLIFSLYCEIQWLSCHKIFCIQLLSELILEIQYIISHVNGNSWKKQSGKRDAR